jgi:hypothetical protein
MTPVLFKCSKCREHKPSTGFHKDRRKARGLASACMDCRREQQRQNSARQHQKQRERYSAMISQPKPTQTTPKPQKPLRTPQNAKKRPTRKARLKPVSDQKRDWNVLYREKIDRDTLFGVYFDLGEKDGEPVVVRKIGSRLGCERHHSLGREGCKILFYAFCTVKLHTFTHDNGKKSRRLGLLLPEFEGRESKENQLDPLGLLPEYQAYLKHHNLNK